MAFHQGTVAERVKLPPGSATGPGHRIRALRLIQEIVSSRETRPANSRHKEIKRNGLRSIREENSATTVNL